MSARLWWIRHGPTHARTMLGWTDRPADLSDTAAIARLAARLPAGAPVISSDLSRAVATADALQGARPRLPHDRALREIHFGAWEDRDHASIAATDPDLSRAFWERPGAVAPPGGESWDDLRARVGTAADRLAERGGDTVIVAHFGAILTQYQRAAGITAHAAFAQEVPPLSLTVLRRDGGAWRVERMAERP